MKKGENELSQNPPVLAIDFDGVLIEQSDDIANNTVFKPIPGAIETLKWIDEHFYTILWTVRSGELLGPAVQYLADNGIQFDTINQNAPFLPFPTSGKIYYDFLIDDRATMGPINWAEIRKFLEEKFL